MKIYVFILLSIMMAQDSTSLSPLIDKAIQDYENLIDKFPEMKGLNFNLGNIHSKTGDMELAMRQYEQALLSDDEELRAYAFYNMGNIQFENGNIKESSKLFREALKLSSDDEDILHNYALSQKVLKEQQQQEQQQDQSQENKDSKEDQEKQDQQQNSEQSKGDKNQENQESSKQKEEDNQKQEEGESAEKDDEIEQAKKPEESEKDEEKQSESQTSDAQKDEEKEGEKRESKSKEMTVEQKRDLQEAEAILNALKADENNLKKKKYRAKGRIKLEKDW